VFKIKNICCINNDDTIQYDVALTHHVIFYTMRFDISEFRRENLFWYQFIFN